MTDEASEHRARMERLAEEWKDVEGVGIIGEIIQHGTRVSVIRCSECQAVVTVCPAVTEAWGTGCLADTCPSYDLSRDVDIFFDALADHGLIGRRPVDG